MRLAPVRLPAAAALLALSAWACAGDADFSDAAPKTVSLSAEEYRQEIIDLDRLIFEKPAFTDGRRAALAAKLEELARRVKASSDSRFLAIEALEIRRLAEAAKSLSSEASRIAFSNNWIRIRNNLFEDRSWFARSAADLEASPPGTRQRTP